MDLSLSHKLSIPLHVHRPAPSGRKQIKIKNELIALHITLTEGVCKFNSYQFTERCSSVLFPKFPQQDVLDAEIKVPSAENPELTHVLL